MLALNPSTWEVETGELQVQGQHGLYKRSLQFKIILLITIEVELMKSRRYKVGGKMG
jgi:hypothetical protein